ncbi:TetR/AcrR family transcriptional regulator, partial [Acinetobacter baumannii]
REDGFDGLNTNRVAEVAGVSIGSLYQYFHDRRELTEALLDRISGDMRQMLSQQQRLVDIGTLDIRTLARQGITVMLAFLRSDPV